MLYLKRLNINYIHYKIKRSNQKSLFNEHILKRLLITFTPDK